MVIKRKSRSKVEPKIFKTEYTFKWREIQKIRMDKRNTIPTKTHKVEFFKI